MLIQTNDRDTEPSTQPLCVVLKLEPKPGPFSSRHHAFSFSLEDARLKSTSKITSMNLYLM